MGLRAEVIVEEERRGTKHYFSPTVRGARDRHTRRRSKPADCRCFNFVFSLASIRAIGNHESISVMENSSALKSKVPGDCVTRKRTHNNPDHATRRRG
jgi:hypothetical protein